MMENEDWLIEAVAEKLGTTKEKVNELIKKKLSEFQNLTESAALRMVATENGVVPIRRGYKIADISDEIGHINITATIKRKFPPRDIMIKGAKSKVINLALEDQTGSINVIVWDVSKVEYLEKEASDRDTISIANAYSRKNKLNDRYELHLGSGCAIKITKGPRAEATQKREYQRISDVKDDSKFYQIRCFVVRLFTNNVFLIRCGICKKKVIDKCEEHGDAALSKMLFISGILDDGLSTIRASFFDKTAEKLLDLSKAESIENKVNDISFGLYEVEISAVPNKFNETLSLNVRDVKPIDYKI